MSDTDGDNFLEKSEMFPIELEQDDNHELKEIDSNLKEYLTRKQGEFRSHLTDTISMLDEMIEYVSDNFEKSDSV